MIKRVLGQKEDEYERGEGKNVLQVESCPPKTGMLYPVPSTSEWDLIWKQGPCRCNSEDEITPAQRRPVIQYNQCPYKKGRSGHRPGQRQKPL